MGAGLGATAKGLKTGTLTLNVCILVFDCTLIFNYKG